MSTAATPPKTSMTVPLLDLRAQYRDLKPKILTVISEVCESQRFILGPYVERLESQVASYAQARHAVGVSSGTDALLVALMALDVKPGDEIITTTFSFFATGGVISRLGAIPQFCDIDPSTYNLSAAAVEQFIATRCELFAGSLRNRVTGGRVRVLMPVHLYGQCADMDALLAIARHYNLAVVEDAAQAIGSETPGGRRAGSQGDIGCFSFFPSKNLGAFGDGGMCVTNDAALAEKLRILRVHGAKPKYFHAMVGGNFRLDELQAAVLTVKLPYLDTWTQQRRRNAATYERLFRAAGLTDRIRLPVALSGYRHIYNQYVIRVADRDRLRKYLGAANIGTEIYYPVPLHLQECFADLGGQKGDCPNAERAAGEAIALPVYPELRQEQVEYVVSAIQRYYA